MASGNFNGKSISLSKDRAATAEFLRERAERYKRWKPTSSDANQALAERVQAFELALATELASTDPTAARDALRKAARGVCERLNAEATEVYERVFGEKIAASAPRNNVPTAEKPASGGAQTVTPVWNLRPTPEATTKKADVRPTTEAREASRDAVTPVWNLRPTPGTRQKPQTAPPVPPRNNAPTAPSPTGNLGARIEQTRSGETDWASNPPAGTRETLTIKGVEFAFRYCPPGTFTMGSPWGEPDRNWNETPHEVTLTRGFWMLETPVTQRMYKAITGRNPSAFSLMGGRRGEVQNCDTSNFPVENVSWDDCQAFCRELESLGVAPKAFDFEFRLPTEAEWEYACRAGTTGPYSGASLDAMGWYDLNSGGRTHKVRGKSANPWGLFDMHGNVREWCADAVDLFDMENGAWEEPKDYGWESRTDPTGEPWSPYRVLRGGSWFGNAWNCRSAYRRYDYHHSQEEGFGFSDYGFRFVLGRKF